MRTALIGLVAVLLRLSRFPAIWLLLPAIDPAKSRLVRSCLGRHWALVDIGGGVGVWKWFDTESTRDPVCNFFGWRVLRWEDYEP